VIPCGAADTILDVKTKIVISAWFAIAGLLVAQQDGARELFYIAAAKRDPLPKIQKAPAAGTTAPAATAAVPNLGLRYNLVLVNGLKMTPVDSDQNFRKGQCLALQIETNRSGYLYVFARQTSGEWQPLLPSKEMPDESNIVDPGQKVQVPKEHCFEITDPPGTETMFAVLSRDPADIYELNEGIKGRTPAASNAVLLASAKVVNDEVERFSRVLKDGDLIKNKVTLPAKLGEPPNSVFVVNKSPKPVSRIVTEIRVRHQ
jgi:hypothetical protein